ncbi:MAG: hypothetical protein PHE84_07270 [bacterium]|nr:hypothetical protein [bacterium]
MKKLLIGTVLLTLSILAACSGGSSQSQASLAYGGLEMVVSAAGNTTAAPAPFSPMSEPLVLADGTTITAAGIVMEDIRFIMSPGQELRWKKHGKNKKPCRHWNREHMGYGEGNTCGVRAAEMSDYPAPFTDPDERTDPGNNDVNLLGGNRNEGECDSELELGENSGGNNDIDTELDNENAKPKLTGPYYVDLLAGRAYPEFTTTAIPAGTYNTILFRLGEVTAENAASLGLDAANPIIGSSLILEGTFTSGTTVIPFRILFADDNEKTYRLKLLTGLEITPDTINTVVLEFNVEKWVTHLDLLGFYDGGACEAALTCTVDANGTYNFIIADSLLRVTFRDRFHRSAFCGKDRDGDKKLGPGEPEDTEPGMYDNVPEGTEG